MANKRAVVGKAIRDNSIYGIIILKDGYYKTTLPYHHNRKTFDGGRYTGPVPK